ncbi:hypothetical protein HanIR_Chr09g0449401 [Helianthus annuus]|nr:hypothetical protein HanIR_Chr09g0449401 [Helianthus annuus]
MLFMVTLLPCVVCGVWSNNTGSCDENNGQINVVIGRPVPTNVYSMQTTINKVISRLVTTIVELPAL